MLALKLILDDWSVKEALKRVKHLEFTDDSVTVVERLSEHGSKTALKLLNTLAELEEVVVELTLLDVENVVLDEHEVINSLGELTEDSHDGGGHSLTLGVTDFNLLELAKLIDGTSEVHDVLASLGEGIKADKERVGGDLPLVLGLGLVVEVGFLKLGANVESKGELLVSVP